MSRDQVVRLGSALSGQLANFLAMLVPVFLGLYGEIQNLVLVSAVAAIVVYASTMHCGAVYPRFTDEGSRTLFLQVAAVLTAIVGVAIGLAGVLFAVLAWSHAQFLGWVSASVIVHGMFHLAAAHSVFAADYIGLSVTRLVTGLTNVVLTLAVVHYFSFYSYVLLVPALSSTLLAGLYLLYRERSSWPRSRKQPALFARDFWSQVRGILGDAAPATASAVIAGLAFHASTLALPALRGYADVWAVVVRLVGGASTIGVQVIGPQVEVNFSRAVRQNEIGSARGIGDKTLLFGLVAGMATALACLGILFLGGEIEGLSSVTIVLATVGYSVSALFFSVGLRFLVMARGDVPGLALYTAKAVATISAVAFARGEILLALLASLELLTLAVYLGLLRRSLAESRVMVP